MAEILGGIFASHVPAIGNAIAKGLQEDPYWKPFFDGFKPIREWLERVRPDTVVAFYNDHGLNFFLDKMPTFAVGAAATYQNSDEGWGLPVARPVNGDTGLSWHVIESLIADEFDVTTCQEMLVDHALFVPLQLCWPDAASWSFRLVPIAINTVQHPLPSPKRCLALGQAVGRALARYDKDARIVIMGTGGLSHQLDGERAGFINKDYDRFCLENLCPKPELLAKHSSLEIVELSGSQGIEVLKWIAARGALGSAGNLEEVARNYHIPISNTAAASVLISDKTHAKRELA